MKFYELAAPAFFSLVAISFLFCPVTPVWALSLAFFTHLTSAQCAICLSSVCVQQLAAICTTKRLGLACANKSFKRLTWLFTICQLVGEIPCGWDLIFVQEIWLHCS